MASRLRAGIAAALIAGGAMALALRPAEQPVAPSDVRAVPTSARLRAQHLAQQWRVAEAERRAVRYRQQLAPAIALHAELGGAALLVIAPDTVAETMHARFRELLDTIWQELGLGVTKITVGVVIDLGHDVDRTGQVPTMDRGGIFHLLPDSSDRATCLALLSPTLGFARTMTEDRSGRTRGWAKEWLADGVGPCAFHAKFGAPGRTVRQWLGHRRFDLAQSPLVQREPAAPPRAFDAAARRGWYERAYALPPAAVGCLAGRPEACRVAILAGAGGWDVRVAAPRMVQGQSRWRGDQAVLNAGRFLADVAHEVGPVRFQRFWTTTQPVETALAVALRSPVGEWTERWQRRFAPRIPLGPAIPPGEALLGLGVAAGAIAAAAAAARRRQVG